MTLACDYCDRPCNSMHVRVDAKGRACEVSCRACRAVLAEWLRKRLAEVRSA